eukprot:COSAG06_NODE_50167_length_320_cov_1.113122_1_plen_42_part_01
MDLFTKTGSGQTQGKLSKKVKTDVMTESWAAGRMIRCACSNC